MYVILHVIGLWVDTNSTPWSVALLVCCHKIGHLQKLWNFKEEVITFFFWFFLHFFWIFMGLQFECFNVYNFAFKFYRVIAWLDCYWSCVRFAVRCKEILLLFCCEKVGKIQIWNCCFLTCYLHYNGLWC